jgi:hypothetical protein
MSRTPPLRHRPLPPGIVAGAVALTLALAAAPRALAHPGPRVWVNVEDGAVTTYAGAYPPGDPAAYARARVFTQAMTDEEDAWYSDMPGFQRVPGGTVPENTGFSYDLAGPLLYFEPAAPSRAARFRTVARHFAAAPAVPQFAVTNELFQTTFTAAGPVAGHLAFAYNGGAGDHNHLTYTLLGDGQAAGGGPDGVYALPLRLTADGVAAPSDPYFLLLGKNASAADLAAAAALANVTLVLPGDANTDGVVGFADFQRLERGYGNPDAEWAHGDFDADGVVGPADLKLLIQNYGRRRDGTTDGAPVPAALTAMARVPEPATTAALAVAALPILLRRRGRRLTTNN